MDYYSQNPESEEGKILTEAVNDYYGRIDYAEVILSKYKEETELSSPGSFDSWLKKEKEKIDSHEFFTATARLLRAVTKDEQIVALGKVVKQ